jgi:hypothetical protein
MTKITNLPTAAPAEHATAQHPAVQSAINNARNLADLVTQNERLKDELAYTKKSGEEELEKANALAREVRDHLAKDLAFAKGENETLQKVLLERTLEGDYYKCIALEFRTAIMLIQRQSDNTSEVCAAVVARAQEFGANEVRKQKGQPTVPMVEIPEFLRKGPNGAHHD